MPTYTYQCKKCEHEHDVFHSMSAKPRVKCEECGGACRKLLGMGSGIIFKGSGFYETDYKTKNGTPDSAPKKESKSESSSSGESSTKSDSTSKSTTSKKSETSSSSSSSKSKS